MWNLIFQVPKCLKPNTESGHQPEFPVSTNFNLRIDHVVDSINKTNEYEKLMQGIFENYLHQKAVSIEKIMEAIAWFTFNDQLLHQISREQCYVIYKYLPYAFANWHLLFASIQWPKINYPNKSYEVLQKLNANKQILETLMRRKNVSLRGVGSTITCIHLDSLFYVRHIIAPLIRSVSVQLLNSVEKFIFEQTVLIMVDMGLSFIQLRAADGSNQFSLDPNIDYLFQLVENSVPLISIWCKQMFVREIELFAIKRNQVKVKEKSKEKLVANTLKIRSEEKDINTTIPNFLVKLQCKALSPAKKTKDFIRKDFFGRIEKILPPQMKNNHPSDVSVIKGSIWFSYKEGFNNAVRKNVSLSDLV